MLLPTASGAGPGQRQWRPLEGKVATADAGGRIQDEAGRGDESE